MNWVAFAVLGLANAGGGPPWPIRATPTYDCVAVPILMSQRDLPAARTPPPTTTVRRESRRPAATRCLRLSAR